MYRRPDHPYAVEIIIRERPDECRAGEWVLMESVVEDPRFRPELGVIQYRPDRGADEPDLMDEPPFPLVVPGAIWIFVLRKLFREDGTMEVAWFREL